MLPGAIEAGNTACREVALSPDESFGFQFRSELIRNGPTIRYRVTYTQLCSTSDVTPSNCIAISEPPCADGSYPIVRSISALNGPRAGSTISQSTYCATEPALEIPGAAQDIASVTPARFRQLPIAPSVVASQPQGFSLRNGHAHMYAQSETQEFDIVIFDQDVRVRAIPTSYDWSYGDGSSRSLGFPGEPMPERDFGTETPSSHVYAETGDFGVVLTTRFRGEYSTEGGPWTPIPGVASVPSTPMNMSVWRTKKLLVDSNCLEDPTGPACSSPFEE